MATGFNLPKFTGAELATGPNLPKFTGAESPIIWIAKLESLPQLQ